MWRILAILCLLAAVVLTFFSGQVPTPPEDLGQVVKVEAEKDGDLHVTAKKGWAITLLMIVSAIFSGVAEWASRHEAGNNADFEAECETLRAELKVNQAKAFVDLKTLEDQERLRLLSSLVGAFRRLICETTSNGEKQLNAVVKMTYLQKGKGDKFVQLIDYVGVTDDPRKQWSTFAIKENTAVAKALHEWPMAVSIVDADNAIEAAETVNATSNDRTSSSDNAREDDSAAESGSAKGRVKPARKLKKSGFPTTLPFSAAFIVGEPGKPCGVLYCESSHRRLFVVKKDFRNGRVGMDGAEDRAGVSRDGTFQILGAVISALEFQGDLKVQIPKS